jgi:hypothetical protein
LLSAATKLAWVNDERSVRIFHVLQRPLTETTSFQLLNWVLVGNPAEFIKTPGRAPPATLDSVLQRDVECRAIHAGLSARNNFHVLLCGAGVSLYSNVILSDAKNL